MPDYKNEKLKKSKIETNPIFACENNNSFTSGTSFMPLLI